MAFFTRLRSFKNEISSRPNQISSSNFVDIAQILFLHRGQPKYFHNYSITTATARDGNSSIECLVRIDLDSVVREVYKSVGYR